MYERKRTLSCTESGDRYGQAGKPAPTPYCHPLTAFRTRRGKRTLKKVQIKSGPVNKGALREKEVKESGS